MKGILFVAGKEYIKWLCSPRMILFAVIMVPIRELVIIPILDASALMGQPIGMFEPCVAICNSGVGMLMLSLCYLMLMSSFPTVNDNSYYYIARMGRRVWIIGELIFQFMAAVSYCIITIAVTMVQTVSEAFAANGWSLVVTDYDKLYSEGTAFRMADIIPPNLFVQMTPYRAFIMSFGMLILFFMFCGMTYIIGCMYSRRLLFFFVTVAHISLGCGFMLIKVWPMFLFPVCHGMLRLHYHEYYRKYIFPPYMSVILFAAALTVCVVILIKRSVKVSLDIIGGDILA